jgi:hypothetical protein
MLLEQVTGSLLLQMHLTMFSMDYTSFSSTNFLIRGVRLPRPEAFDS